MKFSINGFKFNHPFFVVQGVQYSVILGHDFITRHRLDVMYSRNILQGETRGGRTVTVAQLCSDRRPQHSNAAHSPARACNSQQLEASTDHGRAPSHAQCVLCAAPQGQRLSEPAGADAAMSCQQGSLEYHQGAARPGPPRISSRPDTQQSAALSGTSADDNWITVVDYPSEPSPPPSPTPLQPQVRVTIPPYSKVFVPVRRPVQTSPRRFLLLTPNNTRNIRIEECLVSRNQSILPVSNVGNHPVTLEQNSILGWLSSDYDSFPEAPLPLDVCSVSCQGSNDALQTRTKPPASTDNQEMTPKHIVFDIDPALSPDDISTLERPLRQFAHCFVSSESEVGLLRKVPYARLSVTDDRVIRTPTYKLAPAELKFLKDQMQGLEDGGLISRTNSPYRNPTMVIRKSDGTYKAVWDFRKLNKLLRDQPYDALPMESLLEKAHGFKFFAVIDLKLAYLQCPLQPESRRYTAFQVPGVGTFEFNGIPIGTKTAPALFQYTMEHIFGELREKYPVISYFDDNLLCANSIKDLAVILHDFLALVDRHGVSLSAKKCSFGYRKCKFLGLQLQDGKVTLPDSRLDKIRQLEQPPDFKTHQSVCGVFNNLRRFVPLYGDIAAPLTSILGKPKDFVWTSVQQKSFDTIKSILLENLPLYNFDPQYPTFLYTDASHLCAGTALF